jgi:hypothetical protein
MACCALGLLARAEAQPSNARLLPDRDAIVAAYESMPPAQLEDLFLRCDAQASHEMLVAGDGILCAMAWDSLLKARFGGDVQAFLAWWRPRRLAPPEQAAGSR